MRGIVIGILFFPAIQISSVEPNIDQEYFEKSVRPLIIERCQKCHSTAKSKGGLDLSTSSGFLRGGDTGPAFDKKNPGESLILKAIAYDQDLKMPPSGKLSESELKVLNDWIQGGAPWGKDVGKVSSETHSFDVRAIAAAHWAFEPLKPGVGTIDSQIREGLRKQGLKPAEPANAGTLLRRVMFDVTGLPPSPEELKNFRLEEYPQLVDRLLASPHYGERWARHWLDLVRYAETRGHEFDFAIPDAWRYRDYVVRAFNENIPYDRFVREQVAGDLLNPRWNASDHTNESMIATGFWHFGEGIHSPVDVRQNEADRIDNMIDVFGKTFLGLTIACARCHDHKFDPIRTADYYSLYGILSSSRYGHELIDDPREVEKILKELRTLRQPLPKDQAQPIPEAWDDFSGDWHKNWFITGPAFRPGPGYPHSGRESLNLQGTLRSPTFPISKRYLAIRTAGKGTQLRLILNHLQLIQDPIYGGLKHAVQHGEEFRWVVIDLQMWQGQNAYIELIDDGPGYAAIREVRFLDSPPAAGPKESCPAPHPILNDGSVIAKLESSLNRYQHRAIAMVDGSGLNEHVFIRGNPKLKGPEVTRHFLEVFSGPNQSSPPLGSGRLELANSLVDPTNNPLVARVFVNRIWHHYFGTGLVPTPDDFGKLGQTPRNRELLDNLASEFIRDGWNIKNLHRRILLSQTYRQSSLPHPDTAQSIPTIDPQNKLLHCAPVKRLEAESIRDALLAISGRLDRTVGGPGVLPHLTEFTIGRGRPGGNGPVDGNGRRSIYLQVRRNFINPFFSAFDYPTPFTTIGRRTVSNVPAQALVLLNNPFVLGETSRWAKNLLKIPADSRIDLMYQSAYARNVTPEEKILARQFIEEQTRSQSELQAWTELAHALVNAKEFIFLE